MTESTGRGAVGVRIGVIGAGRVADVHHLAAEGLADVQLVGITDIQPEVAEAKATAWGLTHYATTDDLLGDPTIEAVLVLTHLDSHLEIAQRALEAGKHVLIEKPVAANSAEIKAVAKLGRELSLVVMPGHNYAYVPEYVRARRLAHGGQLGKVRALLITFIITHSEEIASDYAGVLEEVMIHHVYLASGILGEPDRVTAGTCTPGWERHQAEDQAWMVWDYANGACAQLFCSFAMDDWSHCPGTFMVKVLGTAGTAVMDWRSAIFQRPLGTLPYAIAAYEESYANELSAFCAALRGGPTPLSTIDDAAQAASIIEAAYDSAGQQRSIARSEGRW